MNFEYINAATKHEKIRAWAVEEAVAWAGSSNGQDLICVAKMIEDYILTGEVLGVIQAAVVEGYTEGRFEAKDAVEEQFLATRMALDELFKDKGWLKS